MINLWQFNIHDFGLCTMLFGTYDDTTVAALCSLNQPGVETNFILYSISTP